MNLNLTSEEYHNLLIQIDVVLNARALSPLSVDVNNTEPLTPAYFLIGRRIFQYLSLVCLKCLKIALVNALKDGHIYPL